ncbi:MAG: regulatory protein [Bacteroidia bacterium]|jgi:regulatory protein
MDFGPKEALERLRKYCAYQERSYKDVNDKMWDLKVPSEWRDDIIFGLIKENFLNEERFARTYSRGKFNIKRWGRIKIIQGLKRHQVSPKCIQLGLSEIAEDDYLQVLSDTVELKSSKLKEKNQWKRKGAIYNFVTGRGFEGNLVTEAIKAL